MTTASPPSSKSKSPSLAADCIQEQSPPATGKNLVEVGFLIGLPRSGTTLLSFLLAGSTGSLSLSEPYLAQATFPRWQVRWLFRKMQHAGNRMGYNPPASPTNEVLLRYYRQLAEQHGLRRVLVKETYRCSLEWQNTELMDWIASCGKPVAAVMRHPCDVAVSSIRFCRHWRGLRGRALRLIVPGLPLFQDDVEVVVHVAENWVSFGQWCARNSVQAVRYEDLVVRTEPELRRVCDRLSVPFEPKMLDATKPRSAFGGIGDPMVMKQSGRPVKQSSVGRKAELLPQHQEIIARICGAHVGRYGYEL